MPAINTVRTIFSETGGAQTAAAFNNAAKAATGMGDATAFATDSTYRFNVSAEQAALGAANLARAYGAAAADADALAAAVSTSMRQQRASTAVANANAAAQAKAAEAAAAAAAAYHEESVAIDGATASTAMLSRAQMVLAQRQVQAGYASAAASANFGRFYRSVHSIAALGTPEILKAGTWGALAIGGAAYVGMKHYADFHKVVLQSVTEAGRKMSEIPYLEKGLVDTAKQTGLALNDTAEIMYRVVSGTAAWHEGLGATKKEVIGLTKEISALMVIGNIPSGKQMEQAARSVTALVNANLKDIGHSPLKAANMVVATSGAADMKPYELTSAIGRGVLQNAKVQGMSGLDVMSWIALMTSYGTTGSVAGTYVKSAVPQLFHPTQQGTLAMAMVGLSPAMLQNALDEGGLQSVVSLFNEKMLKFDPVKNYPAFKGKEGDLAAIQKLQSWNANQFSPDLIARWKKGFDLTNAQDAKDFQSLKGLLMVKMFGGAKNLSALAAIMNNPEALAGIQYAINKKVQSGEYQTAKEAALAQPSAQWNQMKQTFLADLMEIGKELTPTMLKIGHILTWMFDKFAKLKPLVLGLATTFGMAATAMASIKIMSLVEKLYPLIGGYATKRDKLMTRINPTWVSGQKFKDARLAYAIKHGQSTSKLGEGAMVHGGVPIGAYGGGFGGGMPTTGAYGGGMPTTGAYGGGMPITGAYGGYGAVPTAGGYASGFPGGVSGGLKGNAAYAHSMWLARNPQALHLESLSMQAQMAMNLEGAKALYGLPNSYGRPTPTPFVPPMAMRPYNLRTGFASLFGGISAAGSAFGTYRAARIAGKRANRALKAPMVSYPPSAQQLDTVNQLMGAAAEKRAAAEALGKGAVTSALKSGASGLLSGVAGFMTGPIGMMMMPMIIGAVLPHIGGIMGAISRWFRSNPGEMNNLTTTSSIRTLTEGRGTIVTNRLGINKALENAAKTGDPFGPESQQYWDQITGYVVSTQRIKRDLKAANADPAGYAMRHIKSLGFINSIIGGSHKLRTTDKPTKDILRFNENDPQFKSLPKDVKEAYKKFHLTTLGKTGWYHDKQSTVVSRRLNLAVMQYYRSKRAEELGVLNDPRLIGLVKNAKAGQEKNLALEGMADAKVEKIISGYKTFGSILNNKNYTKGPRRALLRKAGESTLAYKDLQHMIAEEKQLLKTPNISAAEKTRLEGQIKLLQSRAAEMYAIREKIGAKLHLTDESARNLAHQVGEQFSAKIKEHGLTQKGFEEALTRTLSPGVVTDMVNQTNHTNNARGR